jgi:hypothetical protein
MMGGLLRSSLPLLIYSLAHTTQMKMGSAIFTLLSAHVAAVWPQISA